jgi:hypothetical protein
VTFTFIVINGSWDETANVTIYGAPNVLPAVSTNGVPAVDLSSFDVYAWAGTTNAADTNAPAIAEWTRQGDSGDTIALTGEDF